MSAPESAAPERATEETPSALLPVELPGGPVELPAYTIVPPDAWAVLALAHGAGAGAQHPFLSGLAEALAAEGVATVRFDFAYRVRGRRMPGPAAHAIAAWEVVDGYARSMTAVPLFAGGKSYGGRMASMAAAEGRIDPAGLVYLGYPLHPPGDPAKLRAAHLAEIGAPQLFLSGTRDPFVDPHAQLEDAVAACADARIAWIDGGTHSFEVRGHRRPPAQVGAELAPLVTGFLRAHA